MLHPVLEPVKPGYAGPVIEAEDLQVRFFSKRGTVNAVGGVSFTLQPGERMAVVGESGSGKSVMSMSLMKLVAHPGRITGGRVRLMGKDILGLRDRELSKIRGRKIAMIFQDPMTSLDPVMRIEGQLVAPMMRHLNLTRAAARERAIHLFTQVGIPAPELRISAFPHELSGGMRQRAMIALALSCKPDLILADEPTTALDVTIQAQIIALLKRLAEETGTAVIFVTHDFGVVARFAETVAVMYAGRIIEQGPTIQVYKNPKHPYTRGLLESIPTTIGERVDRLVQIPGSPPDLRTLGNGCPFAPRCSFVMNHCLDERPDLTVREPGHAAACWIGA